MSVTMGHLGYMQSGMRLRSESTEGIMLKVRGKGYTGYMHWGIRFRSVSTESIVLKVRDDGP